MSDTVFTYSFHIDSHEEESTRIRIYGLDQNNKNVCLIINDFTPYVYLELPLNVFWNETKSTLLVNHLTKIMGAKYKPVKSEFLLREKLYGAHLDNECKKILFPFLFLSFLNKKHIRTLMYKIKDEFFINGLGKIKLKMHEQDADPILQLCCCSNIPTAGWIKYKGKRVQKENKTTLCDLEYNVKYKNIRKQENVSIPSPKIMGFDIEVNSSNPSAMPDSKKPGDKVFQISCVFSSDENSDYVNYLLTLGETSYDYINDNIIIHMFNTEAELLEGFCDLICEQNPNVIVGYNILGFDIPYMISRAKFCRCISKFDMQGFVKYSHSQEKIIKWSSSAYGTQEFEFLDAEGRIYVDLLPLVKRDFKMDNYKLKTVSDYFLGESKDPLSVKGIFKCYRVGTKKNEDGTYSERAKKAIGLVGTYCVQDSALTVKLMYKLQTWIGLCEMANTCCVPIFSLYTQGQQIKVFSQVYKHCMEKKIIVEKDGYIPRDDERYVGAHVFPPVPGVYDRVVPFDFSSLYPTTIIAYNIDYSTLVSDNDNIPDDKCHVMEWEDHIACGHDPKIVRKTNLSKYIDLEKDKMKKLRAKKDITKDTLYKKEIAAQINTIKNDLSPYIKERSDLVKTISKNCMCAKRKYKFLKNDVHKGVIPTILQNLLDARKNTRKEIKKLKSSLHSITDENELFQIKSLINVLDKRQLSYKVSANSMYGAMGVKRGYLPFMPGAMATTYMGRTNIELVAKTIPESYGGQLIYGDTDSNYIHFPHLKTAQETWDYAEYVAAEVTKLFPSPINLEFEEVVYWRFFILTKKRYMYQACLRDGVVDKKVGKKGVLLARRDNSKFIRDIYEKTITDIFNDVPMEYVLFSIVKKLNELCSNVLHIKDFIITKAIGSIDKINRNTLPEFISNNKFLNEKDEPKLKIGNYTVPYLPTEQEDDKHRQKQFKLKNVDNDFDYYISCLPAAVQLAERMKRRGKRVDAGSRLEYVVSDKDIKNGKQYDLIEDSEYFATFSEVLNINFEYYLKLIINPMDQLLNTAYNNKGSKFQKDFIKNQYEFRYKIRNKVVDEINELSSPVLIFQK